MVDNKDGNLQIKQTVPVKLILNSGATNTMVGVPYRKQLGIKDSDLNPRTPYKTAAGDTKLTLGTTKEKFPIIIGANTPNPTTVWTELHLSPSMDYDVLLGNTLIATIGRCIDKWNNKFFYRADWDQADDCIGSIPIRVSGDAAITAQMYMADFSQHTAHTHQANISLQPLVVPAAVLPREYYTTPIMRSTLRKYA